MFGLIAQGDETAFTTFFDRHATKMSIYVSRFLGSDLWAEEIVQDVFLKLWNIRETVGDMEYPAGFVYRMAANRAKDYLKHRDQELKFQYYLSLYLHSASHNTQDELDFRQSRQLLQEAIERLPSQRALIFKLRHGQGLSYDEIALQLGLSKNTIRNQLNLAQQNIRTYLLERGDFFGLTLLLVFFPS